MADYTELIRGMRLKRNKEEGVLVDEVWKRTDGQLFTIKWVSEDGSLVRLSDGTALGALTLRYTHERQTPR